jgi:hypothetical protein
MCSRHVVLPVFGSEPMLNLNRTPGSVQGSANSGFFRTCANMCEPMAKMGLFDCTEHMKTAVISLEM